MMKLWWVPIIALCGGSFFVGMVWALSYASQQINRENAAANAHEQEFMAHCIEKHSEADCRGYLRWHREDLGQ